MCNFRQSSPLCLIAFYLFSVVVVLLSYLYFMSYHVTRILTPRLDILGIKDFWFYINDYSNSLAIAGSCSCSKIGFENSSQLNMIPEEILDGFFPKDISSKLALNRIICYILIIMCYHVETAKPVTKLALRVHPADLFAMLCFHNMVIWLMNYVITHLISRQLMISVVVNKLNHMVFTLGWSHDVRYGQNVESQSNYRFPGANRLEHSIHCVIYNYEHTIYINNCGIFLWAPYKQYHRIDGGSSNSF